LHTYGDELPIKRSLLKPQLSKEKPIQTIVNPIISEKTKFSPWHPHRIQIVREKTGYANQIKKEKLKNHNTHYNKIEQIAKPSYSQYLIKLIMQLLLPPSLKAQYVISLSLTSKSSLFSKI